MISSRLRVAAAVLGLTAAPFIGWADFQAGSGEYIEAVEVPDVGPTHDGPLGDLLALDVELGSAMRAQRDATRQIEILWIQAGFPTDGGLAALHDASQEAHEALVGARRHTLAGIQCQVRRGDDLGNFYVALDHYLPLALTWQSLALADYMDWSTAREGEILTDTLYVRSLFNQLWAYEATLMATEDLAALEGWDALEE